MPGHLYLWILLNVGSVRPRDRQGRYAVWFEFFDSEARATRHAEHSKIEDCQNNSRGTQHDGGTGAVQTDPGQVKFLTVGAFLYSMVAAGVGRPTPFLWDRTRARAVKVKDESLVAFLQQAAPADTAVLSAELAPVGADFHLSVVLDDLMHPQGSASLEQCEQFSNNLAALMEGREPVEPWGLGSENYSMEVSSAGAERQLRLPEDLLRFAANPLRVRFSREGRSFDELVTYVHDVENGAQSAASGKLRFAQYIPRRKRNRSVHMRGSSYFKQHGVEALELELSEIERANLYLDF